VQQLEGLHGSDSQESAQQHRLTKDSLWWHVEATDPILAAIRFDSWKDACSFADKLCESAKFIFRGQAEASWPLRSSLERAIGVDSGDASRWEYCERWMLQKFQEAAHCYLSNVPSGDNRVEWLSLMQHYGTPTRLLDCTHSFFVAAFFAAKEIDRKTGFAVWGFNYKDLVDRTSRRFFGEDYKTRNPEYDFRIQMQMPEKANWFLKQEASGSLIFPVEPLCQNDRMLAQQGLFLFPCCPYHTFSQNLANFFLHCNTDTINDVENAPAYNPDKHNSRYMAQLTVVKLILPFAERTQTLMNLRRMNINDASLFPGLDGFARSLSFYTYNNE
jgi:hypothetical protein